MNYWLKYTRLGMTLKCYPYWPDFKRHYVLKASASLLIFFVFSHLFFFREFPQIFPKARHQMIHHVHTPLPCENDNQKNTYSWFCVLPTCRFSGRFGPRNVHPNPCTFLRKYIHTIKTIKKVPNCDKSN